MQKIQITYYLDGQQYSEIFTANEAREALIHFGYPKARTLPDSEVLNALKEIYNN